MKRHAWLLAGGCLLASLPALGEPAAEEAPAVATVAAATTEPVAKAPPVPKASSVAKVASIKPAPAAKKTTPAAKTEPAALGGPLVVPAPPAVNGPLVVPAPVIVPAPVAKPAPAKQPDWLRKAKAPAAQSIATKQGPSPLRIGGMLLLVATLGGIAFYAHRRRQIPKSSAPQGNLRVLGSTRVGPKATAVVVEIAGKRILLGVTEQSVSNLAWLDDEANDALEPAEDSRLTVKPGSRARAVDDVTAAGPSGFLKLLRNAVGSGAAPRGAAIDEVARTTRDEVRLSRRETETRSSQREPEELLEGQVMGLSKRRRELP